MGTRSVETLGAAWLWVAVHSRTKKVCLLQQANPWVQNDEEREEGGDEIRRLIWKAPLKGGKSGRAQEGGVEEVKAGEDRA